MVKIDSWDSEYMSFKMDHVTKWNEKLAGGSTNVCGAGWTENFYEKTYTVSHFSPFLWMQWQSSLSSAGNDESWGLYNVKVQTFMDPDYIPVYQSRFDIKQTDGWVLKNVDTTSGVTFTECGGMTLLGG